MNQKKISRESFSSYQKLLIVLLAAVQFAVMLDFMIISPIGYLLTKELGVSTQQFGWLVSAYIFSAAITGIAAAGLIDRFDRKKVLLFFFSGFILGTALCAFSSSFAGLLSARIVAGIFGGVTSSTTLAIISDVFPPKQRGRAMSSVQLAFASSQILGIPLGLWIANTWAWPATFLTLVFFSSLVWSLLFFYLKPLTDHLASHAPKNPFLHLWQTVSQPSHRLGFSATITLGMSMLLQPFISIFLVNNLRLSQQDVPIVFMVTGISAFLIMPLVGRLSDRFDKFKIFLIGSVATIILFPIYTQLPLVPFWVILFLNVSLFAVTMSRMGPFQALNSMIPEPASRGAYMSVSSSLQQMAGGLGIVIAGGIVYQQTASSPLQNFNFLGYLAAILSLVAIFLVYRVSKLTNTNTNH